NGVVRKIGSGLDLTEHLKDKNYDQVELDGAWVTPGIVDTHSHMGLDSAPGLRDLSTASTLMTSHSISLPSLPGSYTTSSSATHTPHVRGKVLRKKTQSSGDTSGFTERSSEGVASAGTVETTALLGDGRAQVYDSVDGGGGRARARIKVRVPAGQSTEGQTLFNATAVLVGIGLLSLPLAFAYAGWICGSLLLFGFGWITCYTAKLLSRIIRADMRLTGYTDIGQKAFGRSAGIAINFLFCLELFALGVALVVLFGDTLNVLFPH
ncbi:hypothetical protein C369_07277, partial [Cryptococcus neoformans A5-35-17]